MPDGQESITSRAQRLLQQEFSQLSQGDVAGAMALASQIALSLNNAEKGDNLFVFASKKKKTNTTRKPILEMLKYLRFGTNWWVILLLQIATTC